MEYSILIAQDVGCYGYADIEADSDSDAITKAREIAGGTALETDWSNSHSLRIVNVHHGFGATPLGTLVA